MRNPYRTIVAEDTSTRQSWLSRHWRHLILFTLVVLLVGCFIGFEYEVHMGCSLHETTSPEFVPPRHGGTLVIPLELVGLLAMFGICAYPWKKLAPRE